MNRETDEAYEILKEVSESFGPHAFEEEIRATIENRLTQFYNNVKTDHYGNLVCSFEGKERKASSILLTAHMDELGFYVSGINDEGKISFSTRTGGQLLPLTFIDSRVVLKNTAGEKIHGAVLWTRKQEYKEIPKFDELFVDVGAESRNECIEMGIDLGMPFTFDAKLNKLVDNKVIGKAMDDRCGVTSLILLAKQLADNPVNCNVHVGFAIKEEGTVVTGGCYGAEILAKDYKPDIGIVVDVTHAPYGIPGYKSGFNTNRIGLGPVIEYGSAEDMNDPRLINLFMKIAKENNISIQKEASLVGGTEAKTISLSAGGIPAITIGIACKYVHTPSEMASLSDIVRSSELVYHSIERIGSKGIGGV